jgi:uncharacterized protein (TIGR00255 family)
MTGYGDARQHEGSRLLSVEVRTVNNRYLKVNLRCPDVYASIESKIEKLLRDSIARGTVTVNLRAELLGEAGRYRIDGEVVAGYWQQINAISDQLGLSATRDITPLLPLPGAILEQDAGEIDADAEWPLVCEVINRALVKLNEFRRSEGESMRQDLVHHCRIIREQLDVVAERAPTIVVQYRDRLKERVIQLLRDTDVTVSDADLIREVSVFADRCDINEEIMRMKSHLDQFDDCLGSSDSAGRKLEFLCQEMFREVNTIGSKSNSVDIAHAVVEMKGTVEKLREIVQNVE